jgi:hypothetical protein
MGQCFSNTDTFNNDPNLIILDAGKLQTLVLRHAQNARIIPLMEQMPIAANYRYDPVSFVANDDSIFETFRECRFPLHFHMGLLRFHPGCAIVLTKKMYRKIKELDQLRPIALTKDNRLRICSWTCNQNFFQRRSSVCN